MDLPAFWQSIFIAYLQERLTLIAAVAGNSSFAESIFKAYSSKAKLKVVAQLCTAEVVETT